MKKNSKSCKLKKVGDRKKLTEDALKFEQIAAKIYQSLSPESIVKHNDKICDRQIDISIRTKVGGHDILIIINTKNQRRPANVNQAGELYAVMDDVKAHRGVLICNKGFTKGAKKFAETRGIDLCHIHDAETKEWKKELKIPVVLEEIMPRLTVFFQIHLDSDIKLEENFFFVISGINLGDKFKDEWNAGNISLNDDKQTYNIGIENPTITTIQGIEVPITNLNVSIRLERSFFFGYFDELPTAKAIINETSDRAELIIPQTDVENLDKKKLLKIDSLEAAPVLIVQHLRILKVPKVESTFNWEAKISKTQ